MLTTLATTIGCSHAFSYNIYHIDNKLTLSKQKFTMSFGLSTETAGKVVVVDAVVTVVAVAKINFHHNNLIRSTLVRKGDRILPVVVVVITVVLIFGTVVVVMMIPVVVI